MKKVAIVGVEGSGKTVMLAGLGELYSRPDAQGYFLSPKNFATASYVADKCERMRHGEWPVATAEDVMQGLDWTLKRRNDQGGRPSDVCEVSCLDFAGEVYRAAFGINAQNDDAEVAKEVEQLKAYVHQAEEVIVLVNLRDVISRGLMDPRVQESVWITRGLLEYALSTEDGRKGPRATIVLSQADSYAATITECGGAKQVLEKYLRDVANNYDWLDVISVSAVDKTHIDDSGNVVPDADFTFNGLRPILDRIISDKAKGDQGAEYQPLRILGVLALIGGAVWLACQGFGIWLNLWDLTNTTPSAVIGKKLSTDFVDCIVAAVVAFLGFLLSVCVKPGSRSLSLWRNRFILGMLTFGLSLAASLFGEFATFDGGSDRKALEKKYASCQQDNITGCILTSMGALVFGSILAFGCEAGKKKSS